jgi:hypothetical protein
VAEKPKNKKRSPFVDERGDDDWTEKDLASLQREGFPRNQAKTSGQPKDGEKTKSSPAKS